MTDTAPQSRILLSPRERIAAVKMSLQAWVLGMFGFLPILGLPPGILALIYYFRVRSRYRGEWNPAAAYLTAGGILAAVGIIGSLIVAITAVLVWVFRVGA
jgi:hypothetical protein